MVKIGLNTTYVIHMISLVNLFVITLPFIIHFYNVLGTEKQKKLVVGGEASMWGGELKNSFLLTYSYCFLSFSL